MPLKSPFAKLLYEKSSPVSGRVTVVQKGKERQLVVGGLIQSINSNAPGIKERVWGEIANQIVNYQLSIINCLILGLGGGTIAHLLVKKYPEIKIVGVEIDPEIIEIGKKFFGLEKIKNLRIICADAFEVVKNPGRYDVRKETFDLVVVDIYLGHLFPMEFESFGFLEGVKDILKSSGVLVMNRIFPLGEKMEKRYFIDRLRKYFSGIIVQEVKGTSPERNYIFSGCKRKT